MGPMKAFRALDVAGSGMAAEVRRLEVIAANIANAETLRSEDGGPYRRREVIFQTEFDRALGGNLPKVQVKDVVKDASDFRRVHRPGHPLADEEGYLAMPNVDMVFEMVDLMSAMRSFESNLKTTEVFKTMVDSALQIGRG